VVPVLNISSRATSIFVSRAVVARAVAPAVSRAVLSIIAAMALWTISGGVAPPVLRATVTVPIAAVIL
jgi:hypothetical protein